MNRSNSLLSFMADDPLDATPHRAGLTLTDIFLFLGRRWTLIGATSLAMVALTSAMMSQVQPRYTATAQVTLVDPRQNSTPIADLLTGVPLSLQVVQQEITTMQSKAFMIEVIKSLGVETSEVMLAENAAPPWPLRAYGSLKQWLGEAVRSRPVGTSVADVTPVGSSVPLPKALAETEQALAEDLLKYGDAADRLSAVLEIKQTGVGYVIGVSADASTPVYAAALANAVAAEYPKFSLAIRGHAIEEQVQLLQGRVEELGYNLEMAETAVVDFQSQVSGVNQDNLDRLNQQIENLGDTLVLARTDIATAVAKQSKIEDLVAREGPVAASQVLDTPILAALRQQISEHRIERSRVVEQFGAGAPQVTALDAVIARVEEEAALETSRIVAEYATQASIADEVSASIETQISDLEQAVQDRSHDMLELTKLRRIADVNRVAYEEFLKVSTESAQLKALQQPTVRLLSFAETPKDPSAPRTLLRIAIAGAAGIAIGLGVALVIELTSNTFKTTRELRRVTGAPVIGSFSYLRNWRVARLLKHLGTKSSHLPRAERTVVEEGRQLSHFLTSVAGQGGGTTIVFTSAVDGEGKGMVSALAASALAARGLSVILVDAANEAPETPRAKPVDGPAELAWGENGVTRFQAGYSWMSLAETAQANLSCVSEKWLKTLMANLTSEYDCIIINTTPVLSLGNVSSFLRHADVVVVATRWNSTARQTVEACIERLQDLRAHSLHAVMTGVKRRAERKYEYLGFVKTVNFAWKKS